MKTSKKLVEFEDNAIEIDGQDVWKAESAMKAKDIRFKLKDNIFYFNSAVDADKAFKIFNSMKLIIY